jgi:hypothetical protein
MTMPYEIFQRTNTRGGSPALSIIPDGRIGLNSTAVRVLAAAGVKVVLLLWDKAGHRIAIRAVSKGDKNGYAVSTTPARHSGSVRAASFIRHIGWTAKNRVTVVATWNEREKMIEASLPAEHFKAR